MGGNAQRWKLRKNIVDSESIKSKQNEQRTEGKREICIQLWWGDLTLQIPVDEYWEDLKKRRLNRDIFFFLVELVFVFILKLGKGKGFEIEQEWNLRCCCGPSFVAHHSSMWTRSRFFDVTRPARDSLFSLSLNPKLCIVLISTNIISSIHHLILSFKKWRWTLVTKKFNWLLASWLAWISFLLVGSLGSTFDLLINLDRALACRSSRIDL